MFLARIFTLYPDYFPGPLNKGLYGKAMEKKLWDMETVNIRDYATDRHKTVDDTPYGGGFGMLIKPDILAKALDKKLKSEEKIYCLSPKGKLFNQKIAKELSKEKKERIGLQTDRIKYWISQGAKPTTRVARILGEKEVLPMPSNSNNPQKAIPKKDRKKKEEAPKEEKKAEAPKEEKKAEDKK